MQMIQKKETVLDFGLSRKYKFFQITDMHLTSEDAFSSEKDKQEFIRSHKQWDTMKIDFANKFGEFYDARYDKEPAALFEMMMDYAQENGYDGVLLSGDILDRVNESNVRYLKNVIEKCTIPVMYCPGNHEHMDVDGSQKEQYDILKQIMKNPSYDVFDYKEFEFVLLDNGQDVLSEKQIAFLDNELKKSKPCILAVHIPFRFGKSGEKIVKTVGNYFVFHSQKDEEAEKRLVQTLQNKNLKCVLCGHVHGATEEELFPGLFQYTSSSGLICGCREIIIM